MEWRNCSWGRHRAFRLCRACLFPNRRRCVFRRSEPGVVWVALGMPMFMIVFIFYIILNL
jgi:hypothetical protein